MRHRIVSIILLSLLSWVGSLSGTARATDTDYDIHHSAFNSSFLDGDVARTYGITRAVNLAVVNINVQPAGTIGAGTPAIVTGTTTNIINQVKPLEFKEVREQNAIYYLATLRFDEGDILTFKIDVTIDGQTMPRKVEWQQKFWKH